jgi:hypothetical protein
VRQHSVDKKCLAFETCAFLAIGAVEGDNDSNNELAC